jgi:two-component system, NarL family, response regulator DevR
VVGQARDGADAVKKAGILRPDVVLLDLAMPLGGGARAARQIRAERPERAVCILTVSENEDAFFQCLRAGARGYLVKTLSGRELCQAVHTLADGGSVFAPSLAAQLLNRFATLQAAGSMSQVVSTRLTARERQVLNLVGSGYTNHEIANELAITANTAKVHIRHILEKLNLRNRHQAAAFAVQHRLSSGPAGAGRGAEVVTPQRPLATVRVPTGNLARPAPGQLSTNGTPTYRAKAVEPRPEPV